MFFFISTYYQRQGKLVVLSDAFARSFVLSVFRIALCSREQIFDLRSAVFCKFCNVFVLATFCVALFWGQFRYDSANSGLFSKHPYRWSQHVVSCQTLWLLYLCAIKVPKKATSRLLVHGPRWYDSKIKSGMSVISRVGDFCILRFYICIYRYGSSLSVHSTLRRILAAVSHKISFTCCILY